MKHLRIAIAALIVGAVPGWAMDEDVYYSARRPFTEPRIIELRLSGGYDVSQPFLNVVTAQLGAYYLASSRWSFGLEGAQFYGSKRSEVTAAEKAFNIVLTPATPDWNIAGVARFTPLAGLVNWFATRVLATDLSALVRLGTVRYLGGTPQLFVGAGLEFQVRFSSTWGVQTAFLWNFENVGSDWLWHNGIFIGPTARF